MNRIRRFFCDPDVRAHGWKFLLMLVLFAFASNSDFNPQIRMDQERTTTYAQR